MPDFNHSTADSKQQNHNRIYMVKVKLFALMVIISAAIVSCHIYSFTGASIPPQATTFSVSFFQNMAPIVHPTLSQVFTDALKDKFSKQTNLKLTNGIGDLHFEGSIVGYSIMPQGIGANDQAARNRLTISVRVKFINEFQPENDFEQTFSRFYDFESTLSLSQVESTAIDIITEALVEDIFNKAVVNW